MSFNEFYIINIALNDDGHINICDIDKIESFRLLLHLTISYIVSLKFVSYEYTLNITE